MKKFLKNIFLFACFSVLFYIVIMPIWSSLLPFYMSKNVRSCMGCYGHTYTRMKEAKGFRDIDVLIVGSSHAYRGIDTRVLNNNGIKAFNLGSSAQTPINTKMLLHQYLENINPKLVVYEVYVGTLGIDGLESTLDLLSNNKIDYNAIKMASELNNLVAYNTLLFSGFRQVWGLNDNFYEPIIQGKDTYILNSGYVQTKYRKYNVKEEKKSEWVLKDNQLKSLKENIDFIKSKGIDIYIMQTPITNQLYNSKTNNADVDSLLKSLGDYKNYQHALSLSESVDFYDNNHLNHEAVLKVTEILTIDIKNKLNGISKK